MHAPAKAPARESAVAGSVTVRAALLAIIITAITFLGINRTGFIRICWVPYVVPPVAPLLFLLLLVGWNSLVRAVGALRWIRPLSRGELLLIYASTCLALVMERTGYIIHYILTPYYYGNEQNGWKELFPYYPSFYAAQRDSIIRTWFEGNLSGQVPWGEWRIPILWWSGLTLVFMSALLFMMSIMRAQWAEHERLNFPLIYLPLEITGGRRKYGLSGRFFSNPITWVGIAAATAFNGWNIAHAFFPAVPLIGWMKPLFETANEGILLQMRPLIMGFGLEIWGLSYLVSREVLLSTWVMYFAMKLVKVIGISLGLRQAGFPHFQEVSSGACVAMAIFMIHAARGHLAKIWAGFVGRPVKDSAETFPYRTMLAGFLVSIGLFVLMLTLSGHNLVLTTLFIVSILSFVLVAGRIRAEAGLPVAFTAPYGYGQLMPVQLLGSRLLLEMAGKRAMVLNYALFWLDRTPMAENAAQYMIDGLRLADYGPVRRRSMALLMMGVAIVGMALTWYYQFDVGYKYGHTLIGARAGQYGNQWAFHWSRGQYMLLVQALNNPSPPKLAILLAYGAGFAACSGLVWARANLPRFPLHPLGLIIATLYGEGTAYWSYALLGWTFQSIMLRYGGLPLYNTALPAFLGLSLGHVLVGGVLWRIIINYFIDPVISQRYYINLGG